LIRIKEVPQISERKIKINQARGGVRVAGAAGLSVAIGFI